MLILILLLLLLYNPKKLWCGNEKDGYETITLRPLSYGIKDEEIYCTTSFQHEIAVYDYLKDENRCWV